MRDESQWLGRLEDSGPWAPFWLGVSVAVACLLIRCAFDGFFLATWGFPEGTNPLWRSDLWWPEIVNAVLLGYIPAALLVTHRGIGRDLVSLRPWLQQSDDIVAGSSAPSMRSTGLPVRIFKLSGLVGGIAIVIADPSITQGAEQSPTNPAFLWPLLRIPIFTWLVFTLIASDLAATRAYAHMVRHLIKVDLLDVTSLSPIARRGLHSVLMWVVFSMLLSLFWLGEGTAARVNLPVVIIVLLLATTAFILPLVAVHNNIVFAKRRELHRLREKIRDERGAVFEKPADENPASPRLANLIAYHQLIEHTREWPIDAVNLLKFFMYLLLGLGSWLGGAVVEQLLNRSLGS